MAEEGGEAERGIRSKEGGGGELEGWATSAFFGGMRKINCIRPRIFINVLVPISGFD